MRATTEVPMLIRPSALARFWGLHPKTVVDWIRGGRLVAIRSPGGQHRLRASDVRDFCARESLPVPSIARTDVTRIVLAGIAASGRRAIDRALAGKSVTIEAFASAVEGLVSAVREAPGIVAIDAASPELDVDAAIRALRGAGLERAIVIAFDASSKSRVEAHVRAGATHALAKGTKKGGSPLAKLLASLVV